MMTGDTRSGHGRWRRRPQRAIVLAVTVGVVVPAVANRGSGPNQAQMQQELGGLRRFSECLRGHGMPNWPDPTAGSAGPFFNLLNYHGIGFGSPQGHVAQRACQHLLPHQQLQTGLQVEQR